MPLLKLKADPTFEATVDIPVPGPEKTAQVTITYKHRTRDEMEVLVKEGESTSDIDMMMKCVAGWGLEDEFNRENMAVLIQNYHGAALAISKKYFQEITQAKLGN